ncbi:MAG TPA: twin-arginine translocase subunit TatC [Actinomycetes bacterium]
MTSIIGRAVRRRDKLPGDPEGRMPLRSHLRELRIRLMRAVLAIVLASVASAFFYKELFDLITDPFYSIADEYEAKGYNLTLNFQGIGDPFSYALKICAMAGIFAASPVWMYNLWGFVAPGLHRREKRYGIAFVLVSVPLFLGGAVLAYFFLPKGFDLLIGFNPAPERVANIIGLDNYLSFVLRMFLVFGIAFVLPVFLVALNLAGIVSGRALLRAWRQVIMGSFVFAAIATPSGDPYTMTALAVPMLVLYYIAAGISVVTDRRRRRAGIDGLDYAGLDDDSASPLPGRPTDVDPTDVDPGDADPHDEGDR